MTRCLERLRFVVLCALAAFLSPLPLMYGQTRPLSPASGQSSRNSAEHLTTWDRLSARFETTLAAREKTLTELSEKLRNSENSLAQSTLLLERLSRRNNDLRSYNDQIAQRMHERDMDLVDAYETINRLEKTALKLTVAAVCLAGALSVAVILVVRRFIGFM